MHSLSPPWATVSVPGREPVRKAQGEQEPVDTEKTGQLQDSKAGFSSNDRLAKRSPQAITPGPRVSPAEIEKSARRTEKQKVSESPETLASPVPDASTTMLLADPSAEYPSLYGDPIATDAADTPCAQGSMSPTFLQKEFITKGLTSFPLAVHIPSAALRPTCDCGETLVFYHKYLRQVAVNPAQLRFDQMLQSVQAALSVCRGFLQCPSHQHKDNHTHHGNGNNNHTSLLLCTSTLELTLQLFDYWMTYELLTPSARDTILVHRETVAYGEYEMGPEETQRIRRFLIRGRLLHCKETLGLLRGAAGIGIHDPVFGVNPGLLDGGSSWLQQIIGGSETMADSFLQAMSDGSCICV